MQRHTIKGTKPIKQKTMKTKVIGLILWTVIVQACQAQAIKIAGYNVVEEKTTTGRLIYRANAPYKMVHGQIGCLDQSGSWPADRGGTVVASGSPEEIMKVSDSYTGQYLRKVLNKRGSSAIV